MSTRTSPLGTLAERSARARSLFCRVDSTPCRSGCARRQVAQLSRS